MGYKNIDKENKRELKALDDAQLDMVAGGEGATLEYDYQCLCCANEWTSREVFQICPSCKYGYIEVVNVRDTSCPVEHCL